MASSADDGDDSVDELQSFQEFSPRKSADAPSVTALQHRPRMSSPSDANHGTGEDKNADGASEDAIEDDGDVAFRIELPPAINTEQYTYVSAESDDGYVDCVESEIEDSENVSYHIRYDDGGDDIVPFERLLQLCNGQNALDVFHNPNEVEEESDIPRRTGKSRELSKRQANILSYTRKRTSTRGHLQSCNTSDEDELSINQSDSRRRRAASPRRSLRSKTDSHAPKNKRYSGMTSPDEGSSSDELASRSLGRRSLGALSSNDRRTRGKFARPSMNVDYSDDVTGDVDSDASGIVVKRSSGRLGRGHPTRGRPGRGGMSKKSGMFGRRKKDYDDSSEAPEPTRKSGRSTKVSKNMRDQLEDEELYADSDVEETGPKIISVREIFQPLAANNHFSVIHNRRCDVCSGANAASNKGPSPLIQCQGCTTSIHKVCLGYRSQREHLVTKVGEGDFVLQCRRCIGLARKKDRSAPDLGACQECKKPGLACAPFSTKKTSKQEEKLREDNGGTDPITLVSPDLLNNHATLLFRCVSCKRGFHFEHLPPLNSSGYSPDDVADLQEARFAEYELHWNCKDCLDVPGKPQGMVAWRPANLETYAPGRTLESLTEDEKEYLIKWQGMSYFSCTWAPGAWVWGITAGIMRNAFARRCIEQNNGLPIMTESDAIPEEYLRIEIVLDVKYSSRVSTRTEEIDKARIKEVDEVLVKFTGLGYDEIAWESPPQPIETERYADYHAAYLEFVAGKYFKQHGSKVKERLTQYRQSNFERNVLLEAQPAALTGGKLMEYQMEGMNWLLYNFHREKNVILADEMGLGKTIQVIAALTALIKEKPKCWPFLIVVPNSTCPNWRREIKQWAPSLRVVTYYGSREARETAMKYELFPEGRSELAAHIVVTSYEAPVDESSRAFFRKTKWAGLIVDEGQRLKNDKNLLYGALTALHVPFRVLLTGTPLQNNKKELFTLLQFLDPEINATTLDEKYEELTNENLPELHDLIRPYFLRRTKAMVLKFLPPMAQVIIPVTMSTVQKKLYKSILSKSPELLRSIFGKDQAQLKPSERGSLNNILMQLRKCLCHPFVYSEAIEERSNNRAVLHRNLVDASSKLQLLEIMLQKLQERGHRVLIFSQFLKQLDIIEDFLDGLGLQFQRLDGNVGTLEKQKRIDAFNAPDSPLFAFLLSTRAGGVGINLATADTVIIMDPDFNPHQDLQALSRAHRIGQKNKVLVFQLMTKDSAEEKIVQIGRKKMALDHALIEAMDEDDDAGVDLQTILQHGATALFEDDDQNDIRYDSASVDKLLDRTQMETTNTGDDKSAESQFSYARIWANDSGALQDDVGDPDSEEPMPNTDFWEKILKEREAEAAREELAKQKQFGRGKRARQVTSGYTDAANEEMTPRKFKKLRVLGESDGEFTRQSSEAEEEEESDAGFVDPTELAQAKARSGGRVDAFQRARIVRDVPNLSDDPDFMRTFGNTATHNRLCLACDSMHAVGQCPLKRSGVEHCGLCGMAHYGFIQSGSEAACPKFSSETQVRLMLDSLKMSTEPKEIIEPARMYLRGVIGNLVKKKKKDLELQAARSRPILPPSRPGAMQPQWRVAPPQRR
ncbi:hypothetical protein VE01_06068 [Pseudogymnoascus verrucosus]|uniref:Chromatin remodeling complex subunit n=1 Tax=Pseudogymnoascus verrucosus TaxID=342668 RepID=A0A1B8GJ18_9PEZI|nr:uncharacterized protein VE01_06068 [Pseudogymnoascus verrucosus]OBT95840.2 hypothetical protein VE01_06068 [Pseudogymnoascus verrucosus]